MIEIKLAVLISCAICKVIGELWQHNFQRFLMPVIIALGVSLVSHVWWLGFTCLPMIGFLCMGYKDYGKSDGFARGAWLAVICASAGLGCVISGHLAIYMYLPYVALGGVWGGVTRSWWNVIIAPISGLIIGSLIFLIH